MNLPGLGGPGIDAATIELWAAAGESERQEFKTSTGLKEEATKALCGMLNGSGGRVLIGVGPDGVVRGQQASDKTLEDLAATFRRIQPEVQPHIDRVQFPGGDVLAVTVMSGRFKPYLYRGVPYRRVGATSQRMTNEEQQRLILEQAHESRRWEDDAARLSITDLDVDELAARVAEGQRRERIGELGVSTQEKLLALGLWQHGGPTHAAAVLFGRQARLESLYPQCAVRLAAFAGETEADPFEEIKLEHNHAFDLLDTTERFLGDHLRIRSHLDTGSFYRTDTPEIPRLALREAIINAIAHREYHNAAGSIMIRIFDDRVHVISAGGLHFGLTPDQLYRPHRAMPWNPQIAQTLYRCGLVDTMGTGTVRMARMIREQGLPIPVITDDNGAVTVTFTRPGHAPPALRQHNLKPRQLALIEAIAAGFTTRGAIGKKLDLTDRSSRRALEELQSRSLVVFQGAGAGARWELTGDALTAYPDLVGTTTERGA